MAMALPLRAAHAGGERTREDAMTSGYLPGIIGAGDLVAELASMATEAGANTGVWPGLTVYRFTAPAGPTWEEVLEYMRAHLSEPLTVADLADLADLSPSAFAHLFRDITGRSPYQFLKEMRLDRARELLVDGNFTVARISKEVGYASVSHFISEFRGRFGVTPRAYYDAHALHRDLDTQRAESGTQTGMGNS
jgi:AraC-like DNA-binding protein